MKNGFFWIRGCVDNREGVQKAIESKHGKISLWDFSNPRNYFFGIEDGDCDYLSAEDSELGNAIIEAIKAYGTELKPVPKDKPIKKEETFKPFDRIIGLHRSAVEPYDTIWRADFFCRKTDGFPPYEGTSGYCYIKICHYEDWMQKYVNTSIPFDEWVKDE